MKSDIEITVAVELRCKECGDELSFEFDQYNEFEVEPCERCLKEASESGYDEGYQKGESDAQDHFDKLSSKEDEHDR